MEDTICLDWQNERWLCCFTYQNLDKLHKGTCQYRDNQADWDEQADR